MEIIIKCEPKEIAALVSEVQKRPDVEYKKASIYIGKKKLTESLIDCIKS